MNLVFISPNFPDNFPYFCAALKKAGIKALGIAEDPYDTLNPTLHDSLTEYFCVDSLEDYDEVLRALGYFTHKHGKIDRISSHNEYWLELEAQLRTDFNVEGTNLKQIKPIKHKSEMKKKFKKAGITVVKGEKVGDLKKSLRFIKKAGYPVICKPDKGVGAADIYKVTNEEELTAFHENEKNAKGYFMEEMVDGTIVTFDGLVDQNGEIVFSSSIEYTTGIMDVVNQDTHVGYYTYRELPKDLEEQGKAALKAFEVKEKFFHIEFFRRHNKAKDLVGLEVNMRPPGGWTLDLYNFANGIDLYQSWADMLAGKTKMVEKTPEYHCCYISRKDHISYIYSHEEVLKKYEEKMPKHAAMPKVVSKALGNYGYVLQVKGLKEYQEALTFIHAVREDSEVVEEVSSQEKVVA